MSEDQRRVREERDAYKRVFSQIRIPEPVSLETVRKEERTGGWMKFYTKRAAAVAAAMVIVASTGVAYAADLGGLRTTVNVWLRGENKEIVADPNGDGGYTFYEEGNDEPVGSGGGVYIDDNGQEHVLGPQDVANTMVPVVEKRDDGSYWLSEEENCWDVTEYVTVGKEVHFHGKSMYYDVLVEEHSLSVESGPKSKPGVAYIELNQ
ncbi:hypothetical protein [uncultured Faecalibaculum sp.]|uniref:hypothetical protein n=1 Tax=uncultured Faecalibaculum sp. TaxID=1729681 RepID=UPI0025CC6FEF|nr:hypothetical protein [uncultured Faecalibaculum sp.]